MVLHIRKITFLSVTSSVCMFSILTFVFSFFFFFYDTVGQDEGKTNYVVKYADLSFMTLGICHRLMMGFSHPKF